MKIIKRKECISCGENLEEVYTIRDFPIYMGVTDQKDRNKDNYSDMVFTKCVNCSCIQIRDLIPLEVLYKDGHCRSIGRTWQDHHERFSKFVSKYAKGDVVEVGGAHLILAKHLEKNKDIKSITVYDKNIIISKGEPTDKIVIKEEFFDKDTVQKAPNAIIHSHVIEHFYEPMAEVKNMADLLEDGSHMIISAPVIDAMMKDGFTNAMNFEHTYGLSKKMLKRILRHSSLRILEEFDFSEYCVFIAAQKDSSMEYLDLKSEIHDAAYFYQFIENYQKEILEIKNKLNQNKNTFIFGAHIFTQFLLKFGLEEELFSFVLDNDPAKINNRLYGTNLYVKSPKILNNIENPLVILKAGQYTEEIKNDILENINPNTRFIL